MKIHGSEVECGSFHTIELNNKTKVTCEKCIKILEKTQNNKFEFNGNFFYIRRTK